MRSRLLVAPILFLVGCGATAEDIEKWKGTQRGPDKLRAVVQDDGASAQLRGLAAAALVEIGLAPEARGDLEKASAASKPAVVHELIAPLATLLGQTTTTPGPTTPMQRTAKDFLFELRGDAVPADRTRIDQLLIDWTTIDLAARSSQGGESTEKILAAIGPPAADKLVGLVRPCPDLIPAAKLIGELGNAVAQREATAKLVATARNAPTGLSAVAEDQLRALGLIGGDTATQFLLEVANKSGKTSRQKALQALAQGPLVGNKAALDGAMAVAGDTHAAGEVREAAFLVLEKVGPAAVDGLVRLFHDPNPVVRQRAVEAALKAGGDKAIGPVLGALWTDKPWTSEDLDSYVVHDLTLVGAEGVPALEAALKSAGPLGKVAALRGLAKVGTLKDADAVTPLLTDNTACPVTPASRVSDEAQKAKALLATRH